MKSRPIVYVDGQRQVVVLDQRGSHGLTSADLMWASWGQFESPDVYSWPVFSPDARRVAAFSIAKDGERNRVWVSDLDGMIDCEVGALGGRVPIYLQWSREGDRLAVLSQDGQELVLTEADPLAVRPDREWLRGSPLFFTWLPGGRLASFVGEGVPTVPSLVVLAADGARRELLGSPGNFCAPIVVENQLAYVAHRRNQVVVLASTFDGHHVRELEVVDGLVALMPAPSGPWLARAVSPDGTGAYENLSLLHCETAEQTPVCDAMCVAFFWLPNGLGFVIAQRDEERQVVTWSKVDLQGRRQSLISLVPSRDSSVYLRFFEQYAQSHPIVDPLGHALVLCGHEPGEPDAPSKVLYVPLDGGPVETVSEGMFACFAPVPAFPL